MIYYKSVFTHQKNTHNKFADLECLGDWFQVLLVLELILIFEFIFPLVL